MAGLRRKFPSDASLSIPKKAIRQPIPAKSAPNQKATEKPWLSAFVITFAAWPWAPMNLVVADTAIVERTATPSAPPICCVVVISPDATPASFVGDAGHCADGYRHEREAEANASQEESGQQRAHVRSIG